MHGIVWGGGCAWRGARPLKRTPTSAAQATPRSSLSTAAAASAVDKKPPVQPRTWAEGRLQALYGFKDVTDPEAVRASLPSYASGANVPTPSAGASLGTPSTIDVAASPQAADPLGSGGGAASG